MAKISDSRKLDRGSYTPAERGMDATPVQMPHPPNLPDYLAISPFMLSSLPVSASNSDQYTRQFYGRGNLPILRILPLGI